METDGRFHGAGLTIERIAAQAEPLAQIFKRYGVLHLPRVLLGDETFEWMMREIKALTLHLLNQAGCHEADGLSLESMLAELRACAPTYPAFLYDMLTRPMKLTSGNLLKHHASLVMLAQHIFGHEALVASPFQSDNFLMVPPGNDNNRFVLPIHQDFPYQMQSAQQITYWLSLSTNAPGVGGVKVWAGSHALGLCQCRKNINGHYEAHIDEETLAHYPAYEIAWDYGDLLVLHGLTLHQALPNSTADRTRLVQLFRYSNVNTVESTRYFWQSNIYTRRGVSFTDVYPAYDLTPATGATVRLTY